MGNRKEFKNLNTLTLKKWLAIGSILLSLVLPTQVAYAESLRIASWNIAWLSETGYPQYSESMRNQDDWQTLSYYSDKLNADVLALQEVNGKGAISKLVGDGYHVFLSERSLANNSSNQFKDINQYTGFAVNKRYSVVEHRDLNLNVDRNGKLRFATYIEIVRPEAPSIHALSVHLKAGCQSKERNNRSCRILRAQGEKLNAWINEREAEGDEYLIMGDFNHNLAFKGDWLLTLLSKGNSLELASQNTKATCEIRSNRNPNQTHRFRNLIDHILVSPGITSRSVAQLNYQKQDVLSYTLSDHCPVQGLIK